MLDHDINNHIHNSIFIFIILKCRLQVMLLPMTHITFRYISLFFFAFYSFKLHKFGTGQTFNYNLGYRFVFISIANRDCQVNVKVSKFVYKMHFPILTSMFKSATSPGFYVLFLKCFGN